MDKLKLRYLIREAIENVAGISSKFSIGDKVTTVDGVTATVTMAEHPFYTVELEETGTTKSFNFKDLAPFQEKEIAPTSEGKAKTVANKLIKERDTKLKETYMKGKEKLKAMEASIDEIKTQIEGKMSEATSNPDMRESLTAESNSLMEKLSMLEAQVEKLREVLEAEGLRFEKKSSKKDKKEDEKEEKEDK